LSDSCREDHGERKEFSGCKRKKKNRCRGGKPHVRRGEVGESHADKKKELGSAEVAVSSPESSAEKEKILVKRLGHGESRFEEEK